MAAPSKLPEWDTSETNMIEVSPQHKSEGWLAPGGIPEKPPFQYFNWWQNLVYKWIKHLSENTSGGGSTGVNTMSELLTFTDYNLSVNVRGYNSPNDDGGGVFNYDTTMDKSLANSGTIIDPSVSLTAQGTGTGNGCWIRQVSDTVSRPQFASDSYFQTYIESSSVNNIKGTDLFGILRNDGTGWKFITTQGHTPLGFDLSVNVNSSSINITMKKTAKIVATLVVVPDETFALNGLSVGASVGYNTAEIWLTRECDTLVSLYEGTFENLPNNFDEQQLTLSYNNSTSRLKVNHPYSRDGLYCDTASCLLSASTRVSISNYSLNVSGTTAHAASVSWNGSSFDVISNTTNIPTVSNSAGNIAINTKIIVPVSLLEGLTVNIHQAGAIGSNGVTCNIKSVNHSSSTYTAIILNFYNSSGNLITSSANLPKFTYSTGIMKDLNIGTNTVATELVRITGKYRVNPLKLVSPGGNLFIYGKFLY